MIEEIIISLFTSGLIIIIIPIIFFTIGIDIEKYVTTREINRYIKSLCEKDFLLYKVEHIKKLIQMSMNDVSMSDYDKEITKSNSQIAQRAFIFTTCLLIVIVSIALILLVLNNVNLKNIFYKVLIGSILFMLVEITSLTVLLTNYYPLDVNEMHRKIISRL